MDLQDSAGAPFRLHPSGKADPLEGGGRLQAPGAAEEHDSIGRHSVRSAAGGEEGDAPGGFGVERVADQQGPGLRFVLGDHVLGRARPG